MTCPKCGGMIIDEFGDQRCFSCGRRPDDNQVRAIEPEEPIESPGYRRKRSADEITNLVMKAVRAKRGHSEQANMEEPMGSALEGTCSKKNCEEPAAPDSVRCVKHRDMQRASNEAYAAKQNKKAGKPAPQQGARKPKTAAPAIATHPASPVSNGHGEFDATGLDAAIEALRHDLASLERAREILQHRGATAE